MSSAIVSTPIDTGGVIAPFLDPVEGRRRVERAVPELRSFDIIGYLPRRFEVTENGAAVQAEIHCVDPVTAAAESRLVWIGAASPGEVADCEILVGERTVPLRRLAGRDEESGTHVLLSPADPSLDQLADTLRPRRHDRDRVSIRILSHRFGRRLTLALHRDGRPEPDHLIKLYARKFDVRLPGILAPLHRSIPAERLELPRLLDADPDRRLVLVSWVAGEPLRSRWNRDAEPVGPRLAVALRALQEVPCESVSRWDAGDEIRTIRKFASRVSLLRPSLARTLEREADALEDAMGSRDGAAFVFAHRDLHDGQVVLGSRRTGLIDWDLAASSPAGLDPGNFLAHLRLRWLQGVLSRRRFRDERAAFLAAWHPTASDVDPRPWERLALVRLAAVYGLRPSAALLPNRILAEARSS